MIEVTPAMLAAVPHDLIGGLGMEGMSGLESVMPDLAAITHGSDLGELGLDASALDGVLQLAQSDEQGAKDVAWGLKNATWAGNNLSRLEHARFPETAAKYAGLVERQTDRAVFYTARGILG